MEPQINYPGIIRFKEPVTIKCIVNGKKLMAELIGHTDDPIQYGFLIKFSDGIYVEATMTENGYWFIDNVKYRHYVLAIDKNLRDFIGVINGDWYKFEIGNDSSLKLVWVSINPENKNEYTVYFEGDYQFHLRKTNSGWKNESVREGARAVNQVIANQVVKELEKKIAVDY